jgi:hypothetical protein
LTTLGEGSEEAKGEESLEGREKDMRKWEEEQRG